MTAPAPPTLRELVLAALGEAVVTRRWGIGDCCDCKRAPDGLCPDHRPDDAMADAYEAAYQMVSGFGRDGSILALTRKRWPAWPPQ
jgi:hypothetical protein